MTRALMYTTEQGNILKTQQSPVIRPGYNNQMLRSLRAQLQTEGGHPASVDTLLTRTVDFTGELVLGTEETDCATTYRHDQEQVRDNAIRMSSGSRQKTYIRNSIDCIFTTSKSITTVEPESIHHSILFTNAPPIIDIKIIDTTIPLPILWIANAIPDLTNSVPSYPTIEYIFTNGESTVNTNMRTSTTKQ
ncbi:MAG: hypothetical protein EZS28_025867 [Streblomastix strix]|uniref:Uncharacterized protein n=1 Tax=Streblomastix strix TaxID=222440 RepID=A0A5J4V7G6_9EUKA|nr:MAG: hypothetical protein EZS28_025867 [Streblomastix strix]